MALFRFTRAIEAEPMVRGEGLYLRPAVASDFRTWAELRRSSAAFLKPWEPTWPDDDLTRGGFRRRLTRQNDDIARDEAYAFLIFEATSHALLGGLTLGGVRRGVAQTGTLGYWIGAPHARRGHMTRAVAAAARFGFSNLRLHRLEAACIPNNEGSMRVLKTNGFREEGFARGYLCIDGAWRDHLLFGRLEGDATKTGETGR